MNIMNKLKKILVGEEAYLLNILGASGSGKTNKLFYILTHFFPKDTQFAFRNYNEDLLQYFPESLVERSRTFISFKEILNFPCVVVLDDLPLQAYANDHKRAANQDFIRQLTIERHNDHKLIATSQNDQLVLKGLFQSVNVYNLMSRMLPSQSDTVRNVALQISVNNIIKQAESFHPYVDKRAFSYCPETDEIFTFPDLQLNSLIGKPYRGYYVENGQLING